jgi:hypothetical protein
VYACVCVSVNVRLTGSLPLLAGHGGNGGGGPNSGGCYGDMHWPLLWGSGGAGSSNTGGYGGGAVRLLVDGMLSLLGQVVVDGTSGSASPASGGSGGSIAIAARSIASDADSLVSACGALGNGIPSYMQHGGSAAGE